MESLLMSEAYKKLIKTLQNIFEMDKADLDFGIYRIMNQKRDEINKFLNEDLLPQVKKAFEDFTDKSNKQAHDELKNLTKTIEDAGMDPDSSPKVLELKKQISNSVDITALENDVFSKLHTFFSRYYDTGDFISQRRYKPNTYAIPYEGEEVKLYWANHDQYYIKSSEHLRDYAFIAKDGQDNDQPFRIKLVEADIEKDNIKEKADEERRFVLNEDKPLSIENGELIIHFNFIPVGKKDQKKLNENAVKTIFNQTDKEFNEWLHILKKTDPTEKNKDRTLLEKHINAYTARNTFDYFIHKNLGDFLRRELDFFIKNEVLHLDDIDDNSFELTEQQLRKIKILRTIAHKIIRMLAQIEDFQKKLWLKKKFVIETNYCLTIDLLPENLLHKVLDNNRQLSEWENIFSIDRKKLLSDYNKQELKEFVKSTKYKNLIVDTEFYDQDFKDKLLSSIPNIDEFFNGILINSENHNALNLLLKRYSSKIKSIYIDPPYNTSASEILYKNNYRNSSWLSFMYDRISLGKKFLSTNGLQCTTIDDVEYHYLREICGSIFGVENILGVTCIKNNPSGRSTARGFSIAHEYGIFSANSAYASIGRLDRNEKQIQRYGEKDEIGYFEWVNFRKHGGTREESPKMFYPIFITHESMRIPEITWDENSRSWVMNEKPADNEQIVLPIDENNVERRWKWSLERFRENKNEFSIRLDKNKNYSVYVKARMNNEGILPLTLWDKKEYSATAYGTNLLKNLFGDIGKFSYPKSIYAVMDSLKVLELKDNDIAMDYFAGSGTLGHAVINLNKLDNGNRKYILIEMGNYFESVTKPRIKKVIYSDNWKNGKPIEINSASHAFKYIKLESYEDTLNNLILSQNTQSRTLVDLNSDFREDYMLGYFMDIETSSSPSLLNIEEFEDPFNYKLNISFSSAGVTKPTIIDLIETFNYLIGLKVKTIDVIRGFKIITGTNPKDEEALIVWRNIIEKDNKQLEEFLDKQGYNPRDTEFKHIYINGDHTLEDPQSKVKMIEIEFKRLMFDVKDI